MATEINDSGGGGRRGSGIYSSRSPSIQDNGRSQDVYNTNGKLGSINGSIYGKMRSRDSMPGQVVEIPFWLHRDRPSKWISGINRSTTCRDILISLVRASHKSSQKNPSTSSLLYTEADVFQGKLVLVEEWKGVVKPLSPESRIFKIWNAWGDERAHVKFIVKRASTSSTKKFDNSVTSNIPASQRNSIYRNASINHRLEPVPTVSTGAVRTRRKVKRRNSTSSIGSRQSIDELHPKALRDLDQKYKNPDSRFHRSSNLVYNPTEHGGPNPDRAANDQSDNRYNIDEYNQTTTNDNFDQHIEEMMRVIVAQGKLIYDQLQRFNDKDSSSLNSTLPTSPEKVETQAQVHSPLRISKDCESTASSNYDSASTSTSNPPKREYHTSRAFTKKKMGHARGDFIRHPKNDTISKSLASFSNEATPQRTDIPGTRSKSYDNYETIFPLTPASQNLDDIKNASNDELPISRLDLSDQSSSVNPNVNGNFRDENATPFAASSGIRGPTDNSSQSSELSTTSPSKTSNDYLEPRRNISIKQTVNSDFQIVDITNEHKDKPQRNINAYSRLSDRNEHDNSFSSSSASENAMTNSRLSVRGSGINDRLNQSVDLMNLSVADNEKDSADTSLYGYTTYKGKGQDNANNSSSPSYSHPNKDADIRIQRDKLILKTIHSELTKLVQMNDKLAFAEDSVDRLQIAIRQVQDTKQTDTENNSQDDQTIHPPNLSMSEKEAEEHIACAKEQLERLKVANDDASKVIEKNKGSIEDIDKRVKAGKAKLKHLEYDVNVIEKESRKLNKELEKVLKIEIGGKEDDCPADNKSLAEDQNPSKQEQEDATHLSDSLDVSVCTEDVTLMSKISGSVDSSNTEDSVDSSTLFPELLQLERNNGQASIQITSQYGSKEQIEDSKNLNGEKDINQTKLLPISSDVHAVHRIGCFEDIRLAINGSPAGSGASSSGNSSDKSVRFSDTDLIHPHHEYTISSSSSLTPELPDLPDEPASRGSYTTAIKNGCNSSILSLLNKNANNSSIGKPILKQQRNGDEKRVNGAGSTGDVDTDNSDTGLSSLHSSSDEATYEPGTLV